MLRIYVHDQIPVTSLVPEGKLEGPRVKELEKWWTIAAAARPGRAMLVDLACVSFVDGEGRALLTMMLKKGARLLSPGVLIKSIVAEVQT